MGGHAAGDFASSEVVAALADAVWTGSLSGFLEAVEDRLNRVNMTIWSESRRRGQIMGTTVVVLLIGQGYALYLWVGDSRLYLWRRGRLEQLTQDHTEVEELVRAGKLSAAEAELHPNSNVITRAIGVEASLGLDMDMVRIEDGDVFVLASDGLTKELGPRGLALVLEGEEQPDRLATAFVDRVLQETASDNVTVCAVKVTARVA
jgi:serine/threonine protein phosphatase PrpC